jgi:hypothetical protein
VRVLQAVRVHLLVARPRSHRRHALVYTVRYTVTYLRSVTHATVTRHREFVVLVSSFVCLKAECLASLLVGGCTARLQYTGGSVTGEGPSGASPSPSSSPQNAPTHAIPPRIFTNHVAADVAIRPGPDVLSWRPHATKPLRTAPCDAPLSSGRETAPPPPLPICLRQSRLSRPRLHQKSFDFTVQEWLRRIDEGSSDLL